MNNARPTDATIAMLQRLVGFDTTSRESNLALIQWVRDCLARHGDAAGISTLICGPGHIDQAHKPNEFVAPELLARCVSFLRHVAVSAAERTLR